MELLSLVLVLLAGTQATSYHRHWWERGGPLREIVLSMAPNSFDDQYLRCHFKMARVLPALNRTEFVPYSDYAEAWNRAAALWGSRAQVGSLLQLEQAIALLAYTMEEGLYLEFNAAVRTAGRSRREYLRTFHFKVLHFLLTEALRDLRGAPSHPRCLHAYRGIEGIRFTCRLGQIIRFGQFASASLLKNVSASYGTSTTFEVDTCHGANIRNFSYYPEEEEVLIPPFETFRVTNITHQGDDIYIHLRSHGVHSKYNCAWFQGDVPGWGHLQLAAGSMRAPALWG
ncbi:NRT2 ribosyltransferase, partial [Chloropsis hardwickii]|nr:NRT2 ribosyltransferase [Chloropsis hardwickii]